jgi:hypothetical protein
MNACFGERAVKRIRARNGMTALARTPVLPEATPIACFPPILMKNPVLCRRRLI